MCEKQLNVKKKKNIYLYTYIDNTHNIFVNGIRQKKILKT